MKEIALEENEKIVMEMGQASTFTTSAVGSITMLVAIGVLTREQADAMVAEISGSTFQFLAKKNVSLGINWAVRVNPFFALFQTKT